MTDWTLSRRTGLKAAVAFGALMLASGGVSAQQPTLKFGLAMPLTGGQALYGNDQVKAAQWAVDEINKAGGVLSRPIQLIERDDEAKNERGVQIAQELINREKIVAGLGIVNTGVGLASVKRIVRRHGGDTMGVSAPNWKTWWMGLPRVGWSYVLGVWMGRLYKGGLRSPGAPWWLALAVPMAGIMTVPSLPLSHANGDLVFVVLFLPLAVWLVAMSQPPQGLNRPMEWLGSYSLPLYCVHLTVLVSVSELFGRAHWVQGLAVASALVLAWVFSRLVSFANKPLPVKAPAQG